MGKGSALKGVGDLVKMKATMGTAYFGFYKAWERTWRTMERLGT